MDGTAVGELVPLGVHGPRLLSDGEGVGKTDAEAVELPSGGHLSSEV